MALTRDFKETIRARVMRDAKFRRELLREGIESMIAGDIATATPRSTGTPKTTRT